MLSIHRIGSAAAAVGFSLFVLGCARTGPVRVDGLTGEWARGVELTGDGDWVYLRFSPGGEPYTLQAGSGPTRVLLDTDSSVETGMAFTDGEVTLGVDVEIELSPVRADGSAGSGTSVRTHTSADPAGAPGQEIGHAGAGFHFAPTYASGEYELRVSREKLGLTGAAHVTAAVRHGDWTEVFSGTIGPMTATADGATGAGAAVPTKTLGDLRVQSWNVERGGPVGNPGPFGRVIRGLVADVVLLQEWWDGDDETINAWFGEHAAVPNRRWQAVAKPEAGVAVVTSLPILRRLDEPVGIPGERDVRFVGAVVMTGKGPVLVGSMHLKCCGSYGSEEDLRRVREAEAIRAFVSGVIDRMGVRTVILGGDLNLVGSRPPLDTLAAGLDVDGTDLAIADPGVLGDRAVYTWRDDGMGFSPGRLDWVLVGDAQATIRRAFVLDTSLADPEALAGLGIEAGDSAATDHLAVVVDVVVNSGG